MTARRPRRIASDEASSWARNMRLGNPHAKSILNVLALYVNEQGIAWPGLATLSSDTDISEDTILRRLRWLEAIGAIAMFKCWVDDSGVRNRAGRGRPTSSDIQFLFAADVEEIEAAAADGVEDRPALKGAAKASHEERISTRSQRPQSEDEESLSTQLAPSQHPQAAPAHIEKNLERELPPQPPQGGAFNEASEKRWQEFKANYPDGIVDPDAARREFAALSESDQLACIAGVAAYAARCRKRKEKSLKAHLFVRKRSWEGLLASPTDPTAPATYPRESPQGRAVLALGAVGRYSPLVFADGRVSYRGAMTPRLLAMADAPERSHTLPRGTPQFAAWRDFVQQAFAGCNLPLLPEITAPWPWPPKADGSTYSGSDPPEVVSGTLATEDDLAEMDIAKG